MPRIDVILIRPFLEKALLSFNVTNLTITQLTYRYKNRIYDIDVYDNTDKLCPVYKALLGKNDHLIASAIIPMNEAEEKSAKSNEKRTIHVKYKMLACDSDALLSKADQDKKMKDVKDTWEIEKQGVIKKIEDNAETRLANQKDMYDKMMQSQKEMLVKAHEDNLLLMYGKSNEVVTSLAKAYQDNLNKSNKLFQSKVPIVKPKIETKKVVETKETKQSQDNKESEDIEEEKNNV